MSELPWVDGMPYVLLSETLALYSAVYTCFRNQYRNSKKRLADVTLEPQVDVYGGFRFKPIPDVSDKG